MQDYKWGVDICHIENGVSLCFRQVLTNQLVVRSLLGVCQVYMSGFCQDFFSSPSRLQHVTNMSPSSRSSASSFAYSYLLTCLELVEEFMGENAADESEFFEGGWEGGEGDEGEIEVFQVK